MKATDDVVLVRFVVPIALGPQGAQLKQLSETEGGEWDIAIDGSWLRCTRKSSGTQEGEVREDTTLVPLSNIEFARLSPVVSKPAPKPAPTPAPTPKAPEAKK